jgi:pimeloyl-ACP methyl ester carboxylesterase
MIHHHYLLNNGQSLHYTAWGNQSDPVVVCIHGLTRNARDFDFLANYLSCENINNHTSFYVICIDMIGRGESSWANHIDEYSITNYAQHILELLDGLKITSPHWIGTSMGGLIAMVLQLIAPNRLGKLILNDIGPIIERHGLNRIAQYIGAVTQFDTRTDADKYAKQMFIGFGAKNDVEWAGLCDYYFVKINEVTPAVRVHYDPLIATATQNYIAGLTDELLIATESELWRSLSSFKLPIHVLRGEYSDLLSINTLIKMQNKFPLLSVSTILDCGHAPHLMNINQADIIAKFLQSV